MEKKHNWIAVSVFFLFFLVIGLFLYWGYLIEDVPNFFPINQDNGEYIIYQDKENGFYYVKYKGPDIFTGIGPDEDGYVRVLVAETNYDLDQYLDKKIIITDGDFLSSETQCIKNNCVEFTSSQISLKIDRIDLKN